MLRISLMLKCWHSCIATMQKRLCLKIRFAKETKMGFSKETPSARDEGFVRLV